MINAMKNSVEYTGLKNKYNSLREFADHLEENPEALFYIEDGNRFSISAKLISSSSKTDHLVLMDKDHVEEFQEENDMFVDATFRIVPDVKGVQQVLTIMCKKNNVVKH